MTVGKKLEDRGSSARVPVWVLALALALAGLGWMTATFVLGRTSQTDVVKLASDYGYVLAQAIFVSSAAALFFRYLVRGSAENRVHELVARLENLISKLHRTAAGPFVTRSELPPIRNLIETCDEFFYIGGNCRALLQDYPHDFRRWASEGKKLIFLIQDPDNEGLKFSEMPCAGYECEKYTEDSRRSIKLLNELSTVGEQVELHLTKMTPTQSLAIADPKGPNARLSMFLHLPDGASHTAPCVTFLRAENPFWFDLFYERYDQLRERSKQVLPMADGKAPKEAEFPSSQRLKHTAGTGA